ncbi:MAG: class II aldolase [Candidatus Aenigmarchaeota archaeon]|nr:class II aldolase [Candidatus Aenigmarchaeota archaeon]
MEEISELVRISNEIGELKALVQAGGGNSSVKTSGGEMVIKASGFTFAEMTEISGFTKLDHEQINDFFENYKAVVDANENEAAYNRVLKQAMLNHTMPKPSMEAGMHVFLDRVVVHTHPVMANILNCMKGGEKIARDLFSHMSPELMWVDYVNPGFSLAKEINSSVNSYVRKNGVKPEVIFLKNHGIIVSGKDSKRCVQLTISINQKIFEYLKGNFGLEEFPEPQLELKDGLFLNNNGVAKQFVQKLEGNKHLLSKFLIPDDAIYCSKFLIADSLSDAEDKIAFSRQGVAFPWGEKKSIKVNEMLVAKLYILDALKKIGDVEFLKEEDVNYILNMESEKYRQNLDSG